MNYQTIWLIPFIFLIFSTIVTAQEYFCFNDNGNYTNNSIYSNNLNTIFSSLSSNMSFQGFLNASIGQNPDRVNVMALCRGDIQPDICRSCIQDATAELVNFCPHRRQAILWREYCFLRYSNDSIYGINPILPAYTMRNTGNVSSPQQFKEDLRTLLDRLRGQAAAGGSLIMVAAANLTAPDFDTIYGLSQCSPDISSNECDVCLSRAAQRLPDCCRNSRGARILQPSCTLRYETYPFYNLTRIQEARGITVETAPPPSVPSPSDNRGNGEDNSTRNVVVIIVALIIAACVVIFMINRRNHEINEPNEDISTVESLQYDFGKIRAATNDFSDSCKLGEGGFGAVYKGKLQNGQEIAVKRLSRGSSQGDIEFKNEVLLVAQLQHRNLVRPLGFAIEGTERLLVYEFVENASLDLFIFDPVRRSQIDWDRRYKIIGGIAKGLLYLHEDSRLRIIHRDLKAGNILLDGDMNPKIADFGMARLFEVDENEGITSRIVGTYGYMAPEYAIHGQFSVKSDVFSFGVLVLEIIIGQKNNTFRDGENIENMLSFAWRNWRNGTATNLIDPVLSANSGSLQDVLRCIHIGLLCVQENVADRPTMASIVLMLNSFSITLQVPSQPAFFVPNSSDDELFHNHNSKQFALESSKNDASISELYPR